MSETLIFLTTIKVEVLKVVHQEKIYKNHKKIKIPKILLSKPEFNVDFKSVLIFATLFILFEILAFECTKVSQKILRTAILDFSVCLPFQNMTYFVQVLLPNSR